MRKKTINIAIIGTGKVGVNYAYWFNKNMKSNLVGFYNRTRSKADILSKKYDVKNFKHTEEIFNNKMIDAVVLSGPSHLRKTLAIRAAEAGKHILCEKPMAKDAQEAKEMLDAAEKSKVNLMMCFTMRTHPVFSNILEILPEIGDIFHLSFDYPNYREGKTWRHSIDQGGGALRQQGCHLFDMAEQIAGEIKSVACEQIIVDHEREVEDHSLVLLKFKSGAVGRIYVSYNHYNIDQNSDEAVFSTIIGKKGKIDFILSPYSETSSEIYITKNNRKRGIKFNQPVIKDINYPGFFDSFYKITNEFLDSIIENREPKITGASGYRSLQAVIAAYQSQKLNKKIFLDNQTVSLDNLSDCFPIY